MGGPSPNHPHTGIRSVRTLISADLYHRRSQATQVSIHSCLHSAVSIYLAPIIVLGTKGIVEGGLILVLKMKNRPKELNFVCSLFFYLSSIRLSIQQKPTGSSSAPGPELSVPDWEGNPSEVGDAWEAQGIVGAHK